MQSPNIKAQEAVEHAIAGWAKERGILEKSSPTDQLKKTVEEVGETMGAMLKRNLEDVIDGIGDVGVTLIIQAAMNGATVSMCEQAWASSAGKWSVSAESASDTLMKLVPKIHLLFQKLILKQQHADDSSLALSIRATIYECLMILSSCANKSGTSLDNCLKSAYAEISNRTGTMQGGTFVKDEEPA